MRVLSYPRCESAMYNAFIVGAVKSVNILSLSFNYYYIEFAIIDSNYNIVDYLSAIRKYLPDITGSYLFNNSAIAHWAVDGISQPKGHALSHVYTDYRKIIKLLNYLLFEKYLPRLRKI